MINLGTNRREQNKATVMISSLFVFILVVVAAVPCALIIKYTHTPIFFKRAELMRGARLIAHRAVRTEKEWLGCTVLLASECPRAS